jgi:luciferase-like monooxygenase
MKTQPSYETVSERKALQPLSQSRYSDMACETLYVHKHVKGATVRNELIAGGRAEPHHILPDSGWVSIYLRQASDVDRAIELLRLSFEIANQKTSK